MLSEIGHHALYEHDRLGLASGGLLAHSRSWLGRGVLLLPCMAPTALRLCFYVFVIRGRGLYFARYTILYGFVLPRTTYELLL